MTERRRFVDTSVLLYAVGGAHSHREPCRRIMAAAADGSLELHASVEAVQEFLFHRLRRDERAAAVGAARDVRSLLVLHPVDREVTDAMIDLVAGSGSGIGGRDAVHAATALGAGFTEILSTDPAFDTVPGLTRRAP